MPRMRGLVVLFVAILSIPACNDDPPDKEIQQAQTAIDAARDAGADDYAHEEFVAADKALKAARDAVEQRDYRLALTNAIDSRERAQTAAHEAAEQKAIARTETERALAEATTRLNQAHTRIKGAEGRTSARVLADVRKTVAEAEASVQEARAASGRGEYAAAKKTLGVAIERLAMAMRDLDGQARPPAKRKG